jgi:DHA1 family bicyclomycin/chloramphenicol resistance-like MFS transporter
MPNRPPVPLGLAVLLAFLSMLSPFAIDTCLPSFRAIQREFDISSLAVQQLLSLYMLPHAVMTLFYGPLSDALGRRKVILLGLGGFTVASVACTLAPNFGTLLLFRVAQGMTGGAGMAVSRAVIRDRYEGPAAQRLMSVVTMLFTFAPAVAPLIGGWLQTVADWRATFAFLAAISAVMFWVSWSRLSESHPPHKRLPFHPVALAAAARDVAVHREFQWLALANAFVHCSIMIVIGAAPAIVMDHWRLGETQFVYLFLPLVLGFAFGAWVSGRMAGRYSSKTQLKWGLSLGLAGSVLGALLHLAVAAPPILAQQALLALCAVGVQICAPTLTLRILDLFPDTRGTSSSVQVFISLMLASAVMGIVAPLLSANLFWIKLWMLGSFILAWVLWRVAERHVSR